METRLLLWIWFAAQSGKTVTQSQAVSKLKRKSEAAAGYRQALQVLKSAGAIAIENNRCSMTPSGEKRLAEGLAEPSFVMSGNI
ncbi:MAG: hypothetical protein HC824_21070, partial [Synechococcales cyanobacterium RM1_1_8]|nr:hypothetical protein [Synechococcales cyanobacterium RM1_1_8]